MGPSKTARLLALLWAALVLAGGCRDDSRAGRAAEAQTPAAVQAAAPDQSAAAPARPAQGAERGASIEGITEYRLANGLRALLIPDASRSTFTLNAVYRVGSRHEGYGETGMAHLLEHMLFKGTQQRGDLKDLITKRGGSFNATTSVDLTAYYSEYPADTENLEFALALEADRMVHSALRAEDLAAEFSVVRNEFEILENYPQISLVQRMLRSAYLWHNYGNLSVGNRSDIERVPLDRLRAFYARYYQPDNAVLVIAGRIDEADAVERVARHFGPIERPTRELVATYTTEPVQRGENHVVVRRTGDVAMVGLLYHSVPGAHADQLPLEAAVQILTDSPSGRLSRALVDTGLARSVSGDASPAAEPGFAGFFAEVDASRPLEPVLAKMTEIVEGGLEPSAEELSRYVNRRRKQHDRLLIETGSLAIYLSPFIAIGDWRLLFVSRDRLAGLTPEAVRAATGRYFRASNRTSGFFVPSASEPERAPLPESPDVAALVASYAGGGAAPAAGEVFDATPQGIERHTQRLVLPSGMQVALLPKQTRGDSVYATLHVRYGNEVQLRGKSAAERLLADLAVRGTSTRSYQKLRDALDALRADVWFEPLGETGAVRVQLRTVNENLPAVLELLAEVLREPRLEAQELENARSAALSEFESLRRDPRSQGALELERATRSVPSDHPRYRPTTDESLARLRAVSLEDLRALHALWGGASAQLAIVGDFEIEPVRKVLETRFADWVSTSPREPIGVGAAPSTALTREINVPDRESAFVGIAQPLELRDGDPDYPALSLAAYVLGGSWTSRLYRRLREKEGWSYTVYLRLRADPEQPYGRVWAGAMAAPQNAVAARRAMLEEIERFLAQGISAEELESFKKSYLDSQRLDFTADTAVASLLADGLYLGRTLQWQADFLDKVAALTPEQVLAAARKHIAPARFSQILAGDLSRSGAPPTE